MDSGAVRASGEGSRGLSEAQLAGGAVAEQKVSPGLQSGQGAPSSAGSQGIASGSDISPAANVAMTTHYLISDPNYQPQERILNMPIEVKNAFLSQYQLARFNEKPIVDEPVKFLRGLEQVEGIRIGYFPVPKEVLTSGPGGDVMSASDDQSALKVSKDEKRTTPSGSTSIPVSSVGSGAGVAAASSQGIAKAQEGDQGEILAQGQLAPYSGWQALPPTVRTNKNFVIYGTSVVRELELATPLAAEHWEGSPAPLAKDKMSVGTLLFTNVSQLPSSDNKTGKSQPPKPCMHLFLFCPFSRAPIVVVERYLREKSRALRVFNGDLEIFGSIECTSTFKWMGRMKTVITGPDRETPIFTLKSKFGFGANTPGDFVIKRGKKKVGMITSKYTVHDPKDKTQHATSASPTSTTSAPSAPHTATMGTTTTSLAPTNVLESLTAYDLFFPKDAPWSSRVMLIVATLYMDYLMGD